MHITYIYISVTYFLIIHKASLGLEDTRPISKVHNAEKYSALMVKNLELKSVFVNFTGNEFLSKFLKYGTTFCRKPSFVENS